MPFILKKASKSTNFSWFYLKFNILESYYANFLCFSALSVVPFSFVNYFFNNIGVKFYELFPLFHKIPAILQNGVIFNELFLYFVLQSKLLLSAAYSCFPIPTLVSSKDHFYSVILLG